MINNIKYEWMYQDKEDYQRFYGNEGLWRNDNNAQLSKFDGQSTVSCVVIHAEDKLPADYGEHYGLGIRHVRGFHGKGFMPFFWFLLCPEASGGNGDLFYGTSKEVYDKAVANGKAIVGRHDEEMEKSMIECS